MVAVRGGSPIPAEAVISNVEERKPVAAAGVKVVVSREAAKPEAREARLLQTSHNQEIKDRTLS